MIEGLRKELLVSQQLGFIGQADIDAHIDHARGFAHGLSEAPRNCADLGPGGGLPSLVLATEWPKSKWTLFDSRERVIARLGVMLARTGMADRCELVLGPAETAGQDKAHRGSYDLIVARGFGPPAMTAECAAPLLVVGGTLVVSEPPDNPSRWNNDVLAELGLEQMSAGNAQYAQFKKVSDTPARFPRRVGHPRNRPLF